MLLNARENRARDLFEKDFVADQTPDGFIGALGASSMSFDATEGYGITSATSIVVLASGGAWRDMRVVAQMKFISPETAGSEDLGVIVRANHYGVTANNNYYYCRMNNGVARITRVLDNTFSTLASAAFTPAQNQLVTITVEAVGDLLTARFEADGGSPATVDLSANDSSFDRGAAGFRCQTSAMYCRNISVEQL